MAKLAKGSIRVKYFFKKISERSNELIIYFLENQRNVMISSGINVKEIWTKLNVSTEKDAEISFEYFIFQIFHIPSIAHVPFLKNTHDKNELMQKVLAVVHYILAESSLTE